MQRSPELEHAAERMQRSDPQRALSWNTLSRVGWLRTGAAEHERERLLPRRPHPLGRSRCRRRRRHPARRASVGGSPGGADEQGREAASGQVPADEGVAAEDVDAAAVRAVVRLQRRDRTTPASDRLTGFLGGGGGAKGLDGKRTMSSVTIASAASSAVIHQRGASAASAAGGSATSVPSRATSTRTAAHMANSRATNSPICGARVESSAEGSGCHSGRTPWSTEYGMKTSMVPSTVARATPAAAAARSRL